MGIEERAEEQASMMKEEGVDKEAGMVIVVMKEQEVDEETGMVAEVGNEGEEGGHGKNLDQIVSWSRPTCSRPTPQSNRS